MNVLTSRQVLRRMPGICGGGLSAGFRLQSVNMISTDLALLSLRVSYELLTKLTVHAVNHVQFSSYEMR